MLQQVILYLALLSLKTTKSHLFSSFYHLQTTNKKLKQYEFGQSFSSLFWLDFERFFFIHWSRILEHQNLNWSDWGIFLVYLKYAQRGQAHLLSSGVHIELGEAVTKWKQKLALYLLFYATIESADCISHKKSKIRIQSAFELNFAYILEFADYNTAATVYSFLLH